ncbi:TPA: hypothetical protein N0F65_004600 [Lagenidium giganteum]|uniref:Uncharacterized protein n=1 Tax=Lagenidium giganteum TaxID=4803 RepID=A0AAV2ZD11_9STRA|nr:TPA: hypothetical protein N0F65_004600 [Lagenidium giganteum]
MPIQAHISDIGDKYLCQREIPELEDFVGIDGVRVDPDKVRGVRQTVNDLQSFSGTPSTHLDSALAFQSWRHRYFSC